MNCSDFDRWLDEGSPGGDRGGAVEHAAGCVRCARALVVENAMEAALRAVASTPETEAPVGFVAGVMARVETAAVGNRGSLPAEPRPTPWWVRLAGDPVSVVSVTLGFSLALFASWHPRWLVGAGIDLATRWLTLVSSVRIGSLIQLDPLVWLSLGVAASPFLAWGIVAGWRRLERTLIFIAVRPGA